MVNKTDNHNDVYEFDYVLFKISLRRIRNEIKKINLQFDNIYAIPRGGYMLALFLSHIFDKPIVTEPTENSLVVDDICDTGETLLKYTDYSKVVLIGKPKGLDKVDKIICPMIVDNNIWVEFFWETK